MAKVTGYHTVRVCERHLSDLKRDVMLALIFDILFLVPLKLCLRHA